MRDLIFIMINGFVQIEIYESHHAQLDVLPIAHRCAAIAQVIHLHQKAKLTRCTRCFII